MSIKDLLHCTNAAGSACRLSRRLSLAAAIVALTAAVWTPETARAQYENKPLAIGSLHQTYNEIGGEAEYWKSGYGLEWPAEGVENGNLRANATWIAVQNLTVGDQTFPRRVAHVGPRATGDGEYFPVEFTTVSRFDHPEVVVDGLPSYDKFPSVDVVESDMRYDRKIVNVVHSVTGITLRREIKAYSQEGHDDYHIQEYTLTNTGHVNGDGEPDINQTIEGVYLHFQQRYGNDTWVPGDAWGANVLNDVVGDGMEQYDTDLRAQYTWLGHSPGSEIDAYGAPYVRDLHGEQWFAQDEDTVRLVTPNFIGTATAFAPGEAGSTEDADDLTAADDPTRLQPSVTGYIGADHQLLSANSPFNVPKMQREYEMISGGRAEDTGTGHMYPHHADVVDQDDNLLTPNDQTDLKLGDTGGQQAFFSYGPYTLDPGESVTIVRVQAVNGLSREAALEIGRAFERNGFDPFADIEYDANNDGNIDPQTEVMGKNAWVLTGRDSLFSVFERAIEAYQEDSPPPRAPNPPSSFTVTSGVNSVDLAWTWDYSDGSVEPDEFEVYRARNYWEGNVDNDFHYELVGTIDYESGQTEYGFSDEDVQRGIEYYYHVLAVDEDGGPNGQPLKSNRQYTQTYSGASLKREPGSTLADASIVPNPYVISAEESVAWPREDQIAFLDVPGNATIQIFTETGELVQTIEHDDGSGDAFWNLETEDRQVVSTGMYLVTITDNESGETIVKKLAIIR